MKNGKILIMVDAIINLFLGIVLVGYSNWVVKFFGLPETDTTFYPNILGAVLVGIGVALLIEYSRKGSFVGLGLGGAISINLIAGMVLLFYLISDRLVIPTHGRIILWSLTSVLIGISSMELFAYVKNK